VPNLRVNAHTHAERAQELRFNLRLQFSNTGSRFLDIGPEDLRVVEVLHRVEELGSHFILSRLPAQNYAKEDD
jgi:hypothetical protein